MPTLALQRPSSQNRLASLYTYPHDGCLDHGEPGCRKIPCVPFLNLGNALLFSTVDRPRRTYAHVHDSATAC